MNLQALLLPFLLPLLNLPTTTAAASAKHDPNPDTSSSSSTTTTRTTTTTVTLRIPPSNLLPNPHLLPPSTRATLVSLGRAHAAPLSAANTFVWRNVTPGSYLADVHCLTHAFAPLRVDVLLLPPADQQGQGQGQGEGGGGVVVASEGGGKGKGGLLRVAAWETFRGNDWGNKGEELAVTVGQGAAVVVDVRVAGEKGYFMERGQFSVLSIFRNPIILLSLVSMALFFGMPKLVENMDPEMRAEWEERQKENPMNALMGAASGQNSNPMGNFDMAAFLAGSSSSKSEDGNGSGAGKGKGESRKKR